MTRAIQLSSYRKIRLELCRVYAVLKDSSDAEFTSNRLRVKEQYSVLRIIAEVLKAEKEADIEARLSLLEKINHEPV